MNSQSKLKHHHNIDSWNFQRTAKRLVIKMIWILNKRSKSHQQQDSKPTLKKIQHKDDIFHIMEGFPRSFLLGIGL
jgi:hypothetical protein